MPFQTQTIIKHQNMQEYVYKNDLVFYIPYSILGKKIYAHDPTPYSKCDQASGLRQQLELASEFDSDLQDTVEWARK